MARRSAANELARLLEDTPDPVYVMDERRSIVFCNRALGEWMGIEPAELIGRRVDYVAGEESAAPPGVAAGLCPPPEAFAGREASGHVSSMSSDGRLVHRRARFVPLGAGADCVGVAAFVAGVDVEAPQLEAAAGRDPTADELHVAIRRFRAAQAHHYAIEQLIGETPAMRQVRAQVALAAHSRAAVLIVGPRGSGRSHVARTIHYGSPAKAASRLVPLDGALLSSDQLRSTIEAVILEDPQGDSTTLLVTGADQLSEASQSHVADFLSTARRRPRIISTATERLVDLAEGGRYRLDLACALGTLEIHLPALAHRLEDLPLVAQVFLEEENRAGKKQVGGIAPAALDRLAEYDWPGNLDELGEVIRAAHQAAAGHEITVGDLPPRIYHAAQAAEYPRRQEETIVLEEFLAGIETELIERALTRAKGNKSKAARLLGMTRPRFYRRLVQLGLAEETDESSKEEA